MGRMLGRLAGILPARRRARAQHTIAERFAHFRAIGAANDAFLSELATLQQVPVASGLGAVTGLCERLAAPVGTMSKLLVEMTGGRYAALLSRYDAIERELLIEVVKSRPMESGPLTVWPADELAARPEVVGPKAARLAGLLEMRSGKVPPFFVATIYAYRLFMEATGIQDCLNELLETLDLADSASLRNLSRVVRGAIADARVPAALADALVAGYDRVTAYRSEPIGIAVRSSAVVEDSESSFAGQFESVLNVHRDGLCEAYKRVVASKYTFEALRYALDRGFFDADVAMPVLLMTMVSPSASGVAYSRAPARPDCTLVSAVSGLAQALVDGRVVPDLYLLERSEQVRLIETTRGSAGPTLRCDPSGGLVEQAGESGSESGPVLSEEQARRVARTACALERRMGAAQDVEWAIDETGAINVVQTRPLVGGEAVGAQAIVEGRRILLRGALGASGGAACGPVVRAWNEWELERIPAGAVLVVPTTSPRLAVVMPIVAAIVAQSGSPTGHMATVAREFRVPCLVGAEAAASVLAEGLLVTVDARAGVVYEGRVEEALEAQSAEPRCAVRDPVRASVELLLDRVAPLTLTDPDAPDFTPDACRTLHDLARFVHQKAMAEMFAVDSMSPAERRSAKRLAWPAPMEVLLLDLGGAVRAGCGRSVHVEDLVSEPLLALIEGMTDPRVRWSGPVGFDLRGFMSVVVRSAADDQRYGEPSYALAARDFVHFASRLAYHFATVEGVCGNRVNENFARFLFHGGAAVADRRALRALFLAIVLEYNDFKVTLTGDRVSALLAKRPAAQIEDALVTLGRLMVASRHLDMIIDSRASAEALAQAFLAGDYGFDHVRRNGA